MVLVTLIARHTLINDTDICSDSYTTTTLVSRLIAEALAERPIATLIDASIATLIARSRTTTITSVLIAVDTD